MLPTRECAPQDRLYHRLMRCQCCRFAAVVSFHGDWVCYRQLRVCAAASEGELSGIICGSVGSDGSRNDIGCTPSTPKPPSMPTLMSPPDAAGHPVYELLTQFMWWPSTVPNPGDAVRYTLQISLSADFMFIYEVDSLQGARYTLTDSLAPGTHYWWRVIARELRGITLGPTAAKDFWTWVPGDLTGDHVVDIADLSTYADWLFLNAVRGEPGYVRDVNADCSTDVADLTYIIDYLFKDGPAPKPGCTGHNTAVGVTGTVALRMHPTGGSAASHNKTK